VPESVCDNSKAGIRIHSCSVPSRGPVSCRSVAVGKRGSGLGKKTRPGTTDNNPFVNGGPYIDHVEIVTSDQGTSIQVFPTRSQSGIAWGSSNYGDAPGAAVDGMWAELGGMVPSGMLNNSIRNQLECHMAFAPKKDSWNLDDWHADVQYLDVILGRCNPNGEER